MPTLIIGDQYIGEGEVGGALSSSVTTTQTQTGKARVQRTEPKDQTGKARVQRTESGIQTGIARLQKSVTQAQTGLARLQRVESRTQTGISRIQQAVERTQSGVSRVQQTAPQTQLGIARITVFSASTQTGTARVQNTFTQTQQGVARVQNTFTQTQQGTARIVSSYTRDTLTSLPTTNTLLAVSYSPQDVTDVSTSDDVRVGQTGIVGTDFVIHQFKRSGLNNTSTISVSIELQSDLAPSISPVYLQIYNVDSGIWETIDSDSTTAASTDFILSATVSSNKEDYYEPDFTITCRVYQEGV
jgi:hypothetical protein